MTGKGSPRKKIVNQAFAREHPDLARRLEAEKERISALAEERAAAVTLAGTAALLRLADAFLGTYERIKRDLSALDYDDLIKKARTLLSRIDAADWIHYKLDRGIDHILVDEAQDTSPAQWAVIEALAGEFFAGEGARPGTRTLFAVGDEKQSIYGFRGADPKMFAAMRADFAKRAEAARRRFESVALILSFRSTPDILAAVDRVFADPDLARAVAGEAGAPVHEAARRGEPGHVEIWPLLTREASERQEDWTEPISRDAADDPPVRLAERIAETIGGFLKTGERLAADGRLIRPNDILVLVRSRGAFVAALDRALKARRLPVAGPDRLRLVDHIAVRDLIALGEVMLLPDDDLTLAAVLRSPLIDLDEEALFRLAHGRPASLWRALAESDEPQCAAAHDRLSRWRARADFVSPFEFYARVLSVDGGRRAFRGRMGGEIDDVLETFLSHALAYERDHAPTLRGFLSWIGLADAEVKREVDVSRDEIRVITVHGAKGLEAPVVFLVDDGSNPVSGRHDPKLVMLDGSPDLDNPVPVWVPQKDAAPAVCRDALERHRRADLAEHHRLLYVAMTRARDRLYVCGWRGRNQTGGMGWHDRIAQALLDDAETLHDEDGAVTAWRWQVTPPREPVAAEQGTPAAPALPLPDWIEEPVAAPTGPAAPAAPSRLIGSDPDEPDPLAARAALDGPRRRGDLIHLLLEGAADAPDSERDARIARFLDKNAGDLALDEREAISREVLAVLDDPAFGPIFAPGARAEVAVAGTVDGIALSGRIDRLVVTEDAVLIVDFKSNRQVPADDAVPEPYLAQLAAYRALVGRLYPGRSVRAGLLWTAAPRFTEIPAGVLDAAWRRIATA